MNIAIGFSIVSAVILVLAYLVGRWIPKRTPFSIGACVLLSSALVTLQLYHLQYPAGGPDPLSQPAYRLCLFLAPALFLGFGRALVLPDAPVTYRLGLHLLPPAIAWWLPMPWDLALVLSFGTGYALWLGWLVLSSRGDFRQRWFERVFSALIALFAIVVLGAGLWVAQSPDVFYQIYALSIALTYGLIVFALVAIPDFVKDLFEQTHQRYAVSTLGDVAVPDKLQALQRLMRDEQLYKDESLTLASLAAAIELSPHQLSELINGHLGQSYSHFVRGYRLEEATRLLREDPNQSILSIALETGFRSQSTFYAAFREAYGGTPSAYRKAER